MQVNKPERMDYERSCLVESFEKSEFYSIIVIIEIKSRESYG